MPPYILLSKQIGETPLEVVDKWKENNPSFQKIPMAYAGRLDPMASGKLLILIGEECKNQENYHNLDKEYQFDILFDTTSDSGDILGVVKSKSPKLINEINLVDGLKKFIGDIEMPYPIFSSKTVKGKPLHTWTMENRLNEIEIPTRKSTIYDLKLLNLKNLTRGEIVDEAVRKINLLPKVTDIRKALGNDFRRPDVLKSWADFKSSGNKDDRYTIATINCICSSGTYMRTLSEFIAKSMNTEGLAFNINRSQIGVFNSGKMRWDKTF
jgi:tRNA pseudouridine(55) synthase